MVRVVVNSPLPKSMGLAQTLKGMTLDVPFSSGMNLKALFSGLAEKHPAFAELIDPAPKSKFGAVIISINGKVESSRDRSMVSLADGDEVMLMYPYVGG